MSWQSIGQVLLAAVLLADCTSGDEDRPADATQPIRITSINYLRDLQPIFDKHCVECHGPMSPMSGLRLDSPSLAKRGGVTKLPLFEGTLATNELFQRVASEDQAYRMPKGKDPLSRHDLALIRRWVEEGCPADDPPEKDALAASAIVIVKPWWDDWLDKYDSFHEWVNKAPYANVFLYAGLALLLLILVWQRVPRIAWLRNGQQVMLLVLYLGAFLYFQQKGTADFERRRGNALQTTVDQLNAEKRKQDHPSFFERYGRPPIPRRLQHPAALARTYYRGNCERNEKLFNRGNYCTNTFELRLESADGRPLGYGDSIPAEGVSVHFEIVRSPGSTPLLYRDAQMTNVYVSADASDDHSAQGTHYPLKTLQSGERWAVNVPIADCPVDQGEVKRIFYVTNGPPTMEDALSQTHYAFELRLSVKDGQITSDSDLWMGCLFVPPAVIPPDESRLPFCEWFDWRPLPVITGANTTDLKALGVLDHRPELEEKTATPPADSPHEN